MSGLIRTIALMSALGAIACGATTTNNPPVYSPPQTSNRPTTTAPGGPVEANVGARGEIPAGQELDLRLQSTLSSETAAVEQRFEATTVVDLMQSGRVLVPAGSVVRGVVSGVEAAGRIDRTGSLTLSFDRMTVYNREYTIRGMATNIFESGGIRSDAGTAGIGAGAGAVIGGILGGLKGAIIGAVIGAGGAIVATEGKDVTLPAGSIIRIRLDSPVYVG